MGKARLRSRFANPGINHSEAPRVVNGRRLTDNQRGRLAEASALAGGSLAQRRQAASIVREVEQEIASARLETVVERGIAETLAIAEARGEAFEVDTVAVGDWRRNENGGLARRGGLPILDVQLVRRASRVDGLASLYRTGSITDDEKRIGDELRALLERARPPMAVSRYDPMGGGGSTDTDGLVWAAIGRGRAAVIIGEIRDAIGDQRAFDMLIAVAGRGVALRTFGAGRSMEANKARLTASLSIAGGVLEAVKKSKEEVKEEIKEH